MLARRRGREPSLDASELGANWLAILGQVQPQIKNIPRNFLELRQQIRQPISNVIAKYDIIFKYQHALLPLFQRSL